MSNVALFLLIVGAAVAFGVLVGAHVSRVNVRQHGLITANDRAVAINNEAECGWER